MQMALYIRDPEVDRLVAEVQRLTKTATKTEAVKNALKKEIAAANADVPLIERIKALQDRVAALGPRDPDFDMKKFSDELNDDM
jgi:antitoxin VapB